MFKIRTFLIDRSQLISYQRLICRVSKNNASTGDFKIPSEISKKYKKFYPEIETAVVFSIFFPSSHLDTVSKKIDNALSSHNIEILNADPIIWEK